MINKYIENFIPMYVMFGGGVLPGFSRATRGRRRVAHGTSRVREPEDWRHAGSSSGTANVGSVREVRYGDERDDDFMPMPLPRRQPSPENPEDNKRIELFEPLPPPTVLPPFGQPHPPIFSWPSLSMQFQGPILYMLHMLCNLKSN